MLVAAAVIVLVVAAYLVWLGGHGVKLRLAEVGLERDELGDALLDKEREVQDLEAVLRGMKLSTGWQAPEREKPDHIDQMLQKLHVELQQGNGRSRA